MIIAGAFLKIELLSFIQVFILCMVKKQVPDSKLFSQFTGVLYRGMVLLIWIKDIPF